MAWARISSGNTSGGKEEDDRPTDGLRHRVECSNEVDAQCNHKEHFTPKLVGKAGEEQSAQHSATFFFFIRPLR